MRITKTLVLSLQEAQDILVGHVADTFINDRAYLIDCIKEGSLKSDMFDSRNWSAVEIADRISELNLAEHWGINAGADQVYIDLDDNKHGALSCVWDIENIEPARRATLRASA